MAAQRRIHVWALLTVLASLGLSWGAKPGTPAPPLPIKPVNRDGQAYDLLTKSKTKDVGVLFVTAEALGEDDPQVMVEATDKLYKVLRAQDAALAETLAVVLVADKADLADLKTLQQKLKLRVAVAGLTPDDEHLRRWQLPKGFKALFVSTEKGKFEKVLKTSDELRLALSPDAPPLVIKPVNRTGKAYDIVARSKDREVGVLFITPAAIAKEGPATMLGMCEGLYGELKKKDPALAETMAVVVVGHDDALETLDLKAFVAQLNLKIAVAGLSPDDKGFKAWDLPKDFKAVFVTTTKGKLDKAIDNPTDFKKFLEQGG